MDEEEGIDANELRATNRKPLDGAAFLFLEILLCYGSEDGPPKPCLQRYADTG